jgi:hypothetical protein
VARPFLPLGKLKLCPDENRSSHTDSEGHWEHAVTSAPFEAQDELKHRPPEEKDFPAPC